MGWVLMSSEIEEKMAAALKKLARKGFQEDFGSRIGRFGNEISEPDDVLLVWQYLRFNETYQDHYKSLENIISTTKHMPLEQEKHLWSGFADIWGMTKAVDFKDVTPPKGLRFSNNTMLMIPLKELLLNEEFRKEVEYLFLPEKNYPISKAITLIVNPVADTRTVLDHVERMLNNRKLKFGDMESDLSWQPNRIFSGNTKSTMVQRLVCYYLKTQTNLRAKEVETIYEEIIGHPTTDTQLRQFTKSFLEVSRAAPSCFFHVPVRQKLKKKRHFTRK